MFSFIKSRGSAPNADVEAALGAIAKIGSRLSLAELVRRKRHARGLGMGTCMKNKWVSIDKATKACRADWHKRFSWNLAKLRKQVCTPSVESVEDTVQKELMSLDTLDKAGG